MGGGGGGFFFNDTATTEIYTLSLHDALPISGSRLLILPGAAGADAAADSPDRSVQSSTSTASNRSAPPTAGWRSEEHTSELQSRQYLVCRLLLEKNKIRQRQLLAILDLALLS